MAPAQAVIDAVGWTDEGGERDDPLCDTVRVASELRIAATTARRWMHDGTLPTITATVRGRQRRVVRLSAVWALRDRLANRTLLPDLAIDLGVRYHELSQLARRLDVPMERHPTSRHIEMTRETAEVLRAERERVTGLHARSMKITAAPRDLGLTVSTVGLMAKRGDVTLDAETDSSGARFITRASVTRVSRERSDGPTNLSIDTGVVPLADVFRFTGRSRTELLDLVRAGVLEQVPGRGRCQLTAESLRAWIAGST